MPQYRRLNNWTTRLILRTEEGLLCVEENNGSIGLPGGKKEPPDGSPMGTGMRELTEETCIPGRAGWYGLRGKRPHRQGKRSKYDVYYFEVTQVKPGVLTKALAEAARRGKKAFILPYEQVRISARFHPAHRTMLKRLKCLGPACHPKHGNKRT